MNYRRLGKSEFEVSEISLGTWQVGGGWGGEFDHDMAIKILHTAAEAGVNFIDTADVYSDGESERVVGEFIRSRSERIYSATKCGRRLTPHTSAEYTPAALRNFVETSLHNMGMESLDLIQLHCPPTEVYYRPEIFEEFDRLKDEGKIRNLGVSVEKVEEGLKAIEYPNVSTVQIIFNLLRQRPRELFFPEAKRRDVGIIVRVPLASGLLSGKFTKETTFSEDDHRHFNRDGSAFDRGETFAGLDFETGLEVVEELKSAFPDYSLAQLALRWILMFEEVSCIIPGASKSSQVRSNVEATELEPLTAEQMTTIDEIYDQMVKKHVHHLW